MTDPQIPTADSILAAAYAWFVQNRPSAVPHLDDGNYANVLQGWRSQVSTAISRLSAEVKASRLPFAAGADLIDLAASEYDTFVSPSPLTAKGILHIFRTSGPLAAGIFKKGFRIHRIASTQSIPPLKDAVYQVVRDTPIGTGSFGTDLPIEATSAGSYANHPTGSTGTNLVFGDTPFDSNFQFTPDSPGNFSSAGGSDGISDPVLRAAAKAFYTGRYAPTVGAITAGTLRTTGVAKYLVLEATDQAVTYIVAVDGSWSSSIALDQAVFSTLIDSVDSPGFGGFGCVFRVGISDPVFKVAFSNIFITLNLTVTLRDPSLLADTSSIEDSIKATCLKYFNDRQDWNVFRLSAIQGAVAACDRRLLACTSAAVLKLSDGSSIPEPTAVFASPPLSGTTHVNHWYLDGSNIQITFQTPS